MGIYILNCHDFFVLVVSDINCGLRERNKISEISILFLVSYTEMDFSAIAGGGISICKCYFVFYCSSEHVSLIYWKGSWYSQNIEKFI